MMSSLLVALVVALPLLGFLINGLAGKWLKRERLIGTLGSGAVGGSFVISLLIFLDLLQRPPESRTIVVTLYEWIASGSFTAPVAYQIDQLSTVMMLVVTGVGFLIHSSV